MDRLSRDPLLADEHLPPSSQRVMSRDSLFLMARLSLGDGAPRDVRVRNLSEGGLMADIDTMVAVGTAATLDVRGIGEVTGRVAWSAEGRIGIALDSPIDPKKARKPVGAGQGTPDYAKPFHR